MNDMRLDELEQGSHLCSLYEDRAIQMAAAVPFIQAGLARGERCAYVCDDRTVEEVATLLQAAGVDVTKERARGSLWLLTKLDVYVRTGCFDPEAVLKFWQEATEQALADGFTGLRGTGEMTWALTSAPGSERLIEYEERLDQALQGSAASALCQYDTTRFSPEMIRDVVRAHRFVIHGSRLFQFSSNAADMADVNLDVLKDVKES